MQGKKIPTLVGLFGVIGAIVILSFAFNRAQPLLSQASPSLTPTNLTFTNVSDTSFTASWMTGELTSGLLTVKDTHGTSLSAYDERDQNNKLGSYTQHSVTVHNLTPQNMYSVSIVSGGKQFTGVDTSWTITTGPTLGSSAVLEPSFGTVTHPDGSPAEGAIVYITLDGSQTLSTLVSSSGTWVIPLNLIRSQDLQTYVPLAERITETIRVMSDSGDTNAITDTLNDNPVPSMVIGKEYDFRKIQAENHIPSTTLVPTSAKTIQTKISIVRPQNGAALPSDRPLFQGTGIPGALVSLVIGLSKPVTETVTVDLDGIWRYTPKQPLASGKQSLTITTKDTQGKAIAMTSLFEILKSGTQVLGDATPSGTLSPTPTEIVEIASPTADLVADPPPVSGIQTNLFIFLILGFGLLVSGILIL